MEDIGRTMGDTWTFQEMQGEPEEIQGIRKKSTERERKPFDPKRFL
jgi:hypothetical protein